GILVIHLIEAWILNPKILGDMLHLHPVMVLAILAVGEHFFGVWGLLLGVPVIVYILRFVILDEGIPGIIDPIRPEDLLKAAADDLGEDELAAQGSGADGE
ncbi:MAG: AI-2E family transporter, partial [Planctomycetota bacterium]